MRCEALYYRTKYPACALSGAALHAASGESATIGAMFSYRHAFHAGNHADVLKHLAWVAMLDYQTQKDTALMVVDTHAGAGLYRLDHEQARISAESDAGIHRLHRMALHGQAHSHTVPPAVLRYLDVVQSVQHSEQGSFAAAGTLRHYPGSPWISQLLLRPHDKLKLFEVHPTDTKVLEKHVQALNKGRQIEVLRRNGFEGLKGLLPPPSRRGMVLIDPSYELKTDYEDVLTTLEDAIKRFPTGTFAVWYPVIARPEAHAMARKLKTMATKSHKPWLQAELNVGLTPTEGTSAQVAQGRTHTALRASGMWVLNPPYTLAATLREALPWVVGALREPKGSSWSVDAH